jgi:multidrug resistance efflux pump
MLRRRSQLAVNEVGLVREVFRAPTDVKAPHPPAAAARLPGPQPDTIPPRQQPPEFDARRRQDHLRESFAGAHPPCAPSALLQDRTPPSAKAEPRARAAQPPKKTFLALVADNASAAVRACLQNVVYRRVLKSGVALALAVFVGWGPMLRLLQVSSVEAVVNARVVTLRAPIDGTVVAGSTNVTVGDPIAAGAPLLKVINRRADRARLDDLQRLFDGLEEERAVLLAKLEAAKVLHEQFVAQTQFFQTGRIRQLQARSNEIKSEIAAAVARRSQTQAALDRTITLETKGVQTITALERARRDDEVAAQAITAAEERQRALEVEIQAAGSGLFLGDSYNDRPRSSQRADELQQQLVEFNALLSRNASQAKRLRIQLDDETARYAEQAETTIAAPAHASVWEVLTSPGEEVRRGQDLLRMLDCSTAIVTATVSESVYNRLRVGSRARFHFRDGSTQLDGRVVQLAGASAASSSLAIAPSALSKEAFHVTVAIPGLTGLDSCSLGRTGRVIFEDSPAGKVAPSGQ